MDTVKDQQQSVTYLIESWELLFNSQDTTTDFNDMPVLTDMREKTCEKIQVNGNLTMAIPTSNLTPVPVPVLALAPAPIDLDTEADFELDMTAAVEPSSTCDSAIDEEELLIQLKCVGCGKPYFKETFLENTEDHGFDISLQHLHPKCDTCRTDLFPGKSTFRMGMKLKRCRNGNSGKYHSSESEQRPSATITIPAAATAAQLPGPRKGRKSKEAKTRLLTKLYNLEPHDFQVTLYPEDPELDAANKKKIKKIAVEFMKRQRLESSTLQNDRCFGHAADHVEVDENFNNRKYGKRKTTKY